MPALMLAAGNDSDNDYDPATISLFEHLPVADLITFVGADHMMLFKPDSGEQIRRFVTAFLGLHLQGQTGFGRFLTEDYVERVAPGLGETDSFKDLVWGVVGGG